MMLSFLLYLLFPLQFYFSTTISADTSAAYTPTDYILLSCGSSSNTIPSEDGRNWTSDESPNSLYLTSNSKTSSFASIALRQDQSVTQVPYMTARIFRDRFTYTFPVSPGPKFLRLYFYPVEYSGFSGSTSFFSVTANGYSLLYNFSAYLTVSAINPPEISLIKEFLVPVLANEKLNVTFSPSPTSYAFVNGIEVVSMPNDLYTYHLQNSPSFVNRNDVVIDIPNTTAFETAYRLNVGGADVPNIDDTGMFRNWLDDSNYIFGAATGVTLDRPQLKIKYTQDTPPYTAPAIVYTTSRKMGRDPQINKNYNLTWIFSVDTGFNYLLRLHFCVNLKCVNLWEVTKADQIAFDIYINNMTAEIGADVIFWSGGNGIPVYREYFLWFPKGGQSKQYLWLALHPTEGVGTPFADAILNGLEIFKLSKSDGSLAAPNPEPGVNSASKGLPQNSMVKKSKRRNFSMWIKIIVGASICITISLCLLFSFIFRRQNRFSYNKRRSTELPDKLCLCFTIAEIQSATNNFDDAFVIGRGGFGNVYKGFIKGIKCEMAIKRLNSVSQRGAREFWTEIQLLSQLRHIHLVSLIGYCNDNNEMILVYEYMADGTLRDHLYGTGKVPLSWKQRLKICIGAAHGLDYLHSGAIHRIIHRDVKSSNILLDENCVAKVSDFGLSKMSPISMTDIPITTIVKGTFGYMDPEYYRRQQLTEKSDVYSFGVVLFEVLLARPAVDSNLEYSQISLANWARKCVANESIGGIGESIDPLLKGKISPNSLRTFAKIAENCIRENGSERPTMNDVAQGLEFALQLQVTEDAEQISQLS